MFKHFFQQLKFKAMARQLRKPSGAMGNKVGEMMNKANGFLYDFAFDCMKIKHGEAILEIGFGNGIFFEKVFAQADGLHLSGIDFSETMVKAAIKNNQHLISTGKLQLHHGSSDTLPFADNSYDIIFCINVVYFWDTPQPHLQEIKRVLKPGGKFYAIIRTKESIEQMPFTRYGFTSYTIDSWKSLVQENNLHFINAIPRDEPEILYKGNYIRSQSLCLVTEKTQ